VETEDTLQEIADDEEEVLQDIEEDTAEADLEIDPEVDPDQEAEVVHQDEEMNEREVTLALDLPEIRREAEADLEIDPEVDLRAEAKAEALLEKEVPRRAEEVPAEVLAQREMRTIPKHLMPPKKIQMELRIEIKMTK